MIYSITMMLGMLISSSSFSFCGTIEMWHEEYFDAQTMRQKLDALKFIHCQPVVDSYAETPRQVSLLTELLLSALELSETSAEASTNAPYIHDLVFKNIMRFGLWDAPGVKSSGLIETMARQYDQSQDELILLCQGVEENAAIFKDNNLGDPHSLYAIRLKQEISAIGL